eukprot:1457666-Prymnesium_polylepis.1
MLGTLAIKIRGSFPAGSGWENLRGRTFLPGLREHATKCWTKKQPKGWAAQTSAFPTNRNARPAEEGELRPG